MREEKRKRRKRWLYSLRSYLIFFLLMAFLVTCCMMLFLRTMEDAAGAAYTKEYIERAAKMTFVNVLLLSLICTVIDLIRRRFMIDKPVRQITEAAEKVMQGDFSVRIPSRGNEDSMNGFDEIAGYFNRMAQELSGIETLRTDFVANVSHELKTPLSVIQNYGTLLQAPDLPEEKRMEYAKAITEATRRLAALITNILKLNKLESQQIYPQTKPYDLGEQLCENLLVFEHSWEEKALEVEADMEENVMIESDPELLSLVWNNLFSNAVKFTPPRGKIRVSLKAEGELAVVQVTDTGCGISREVGAHMFEKFYQGDTAHAAQGNGLGLALVKRVMDITGGEISVSSQVGRGSTFTVKLRRKDG